MHKSLLIILFGDLYHIVALWCSHDASNMSRESGWFLIPGKLPYFVYQTSSAIWGSFPTNHHLQWPHCSRQPPADDFLMPCNPSIETKALTQHWRDRDPGLKGWSKCPATKKRAAEATQSVFGNEESIGFGVVLDLCRVKRPFEWYCHARWSLPCCKLVYTTHLPEINAVTKRMPPFKWYCWLNHKFWLATSKICEN